MVNSGYFWCRQCVNYRLPGGEDVVAIARGVMPSNHFTYDPPPPAVLGRPDSVLPWHPRQGLSASKNLSPVREELALRTGEDGWETVDSKGASVPSSNAGEPARGTSFVPSSVLGV